LVSKTGRDLDGIIAKRLDAPYASGERTAAVKVKQIRTVDCVVGGFRYATGARVIGLYCLDFTATTVAASRRIYLRVQSIGTARVNRKI
jgi:ATP-dependent DNA ligase